MLPTTRNTTLARVSFFTWAAGRIDVVDPVTGQGPLVSFTAEKSLGGQAAGSWSVGLKGYATSGPHKGEAWSDLVQSGDWVVIDVVKNGQTYAITAGPVDEVAVRAAAGGRGEGAVDVTISGRDAGAALDDTPVYFNPWDPIHDNAAGKDMLRITDGTVGGRPHEFIGKILAGFMGPDGLFGGHVKVPPGLVSAGEAYWTDFVNLNLALQDGLRGQVFAPQVLAAEGASSVWQFVDAWRNPALNEMFVDTGPDPRDRHFYLTLRERPFVNVADGADSPWFALPTATLDVATIEAVALARGRNRVNHLTVLGEMTSLLGKDAYALYRPVADPDSVARYGLRRLEEQSRYFDEYKGDAGFQSKFKEWADLILSWNCLNHRFWGGSIGLAELRPDIRVGRRVRILNGPPAGYRGLPRDGGIWSKALTFYVEGIRHDWAEGETPVARTSVTVTRGYVDGEVADAVAEAALKFRGVDLIAAGTANTLGTMDAYSDEAAAATGGGRTA